MGWTAAPGKRSGLSDGRLEFILADTQQLQCISERETVHLFLAQQDRCAQCALAAVRQRDHTAVDPMAAIILSGSRGCVAG